MNRNLSPLPAVGSIAVLAACVGLACLSTACERRESRPADMPTPTQPDARTTPAPAPPPSSAPSGAAGNAAGSATDAEMTRRVREALADGSGLSSDVTDLEVTTRGGRTTVSGTVATVEDRERVLEIIRTVALAQNVESDIRVAPAP